MASEASPLTAFVFSGGAALGATQVGMLRALLERSIRPDILIGTSIGSWNALWLASNLAAPDVAQLADLWQRSSLLRVIGASALTAWPHRLLTRSALLSNHGLRRLIQDIVPNRDIDTLTFANLAIPLKINATDLTLGSSATFSQGPVLPALLASSAIPGIFPPVQLEGHQYVDGGLLDNGGVSVAIEAGAQRVYVLSVAYGGQLKGMLATGLDVLERSFHLIASRHISQAIRHYQHQAQFIVIAANNATDGRLFGFRQTRRLIDAGYRAAIQVLDAG